MCKYIQIDTVSRSICRVIYLKPVDQATDLYFPHFNFVMSFFRFHHSLEIKARILCLKGQAITHLADDVTTLLTLMAVSLLSHPHHPFQHLERKSRRGPSRNG